MGRRCEFLEAGGNKKKADNSRSAPRASPLIPLLSLPGRRFPVENAAFNLFSILSMKTCGFKLHASITAPPPSLKSGCGRVGRG